MASKLTSSTINNKFKTKKQQTMIYDSNFDKLFDSFFNSYNPSYFKTYKIIGPKETQSDVSIEKDGAYISFEVPGFNKTNLSIELEGDMLVVKGEKKIKDSVKSIVKDFKIGFDIDPKSIEATCEDGILTVFIPNYKKQSESKKTIKIS